MCIVMNMEILIVIIVSLVVGMQIGWSLSIKCHMMVKERHEKEKNQQPYQGPQL